MRGCLGFRVHRIEGFGSGGGPYTIVFGIGRADLGFRVLGLKVLGF